MKIKLFTHTDLDGVSCGVVLKYLYLGHDVRILFCNYDDINDEVERFITSKSYKLYDSVFITDISVNHQVAKLIDDACKTSSTMFTLLDHHSTAEWLNKYSWSKVKTSYTDGTGTCGTSLLYDYLDAMSAIDDVYLGQFVSHVRLWDTWEWTKDKSKFRMSEYLSLLLKTMCKAEFIDRIVWTLEYNCEDGQFLLSEESLNMIHKEIERRNAHVQNALNTAQIIDDYARGVTFACVFSDDYESEIGNQLCIQNPGIMYAVIINLRKKTISFRTTSDSFNVAVELAIPLGGGGHPKSAGCPITKSDKDIMRFFLNM